MPRRDHINPNTRYDPKKQREVPSSWAAWIFLHDRQVVRAVSRFSTTDRPENIGIGLYFPSRMNGGKAMNLPLTGFTEAELDVLQTFINDTFDLARPVCKLRDELSAAREAAGDDSDYRIYRRLPELVVRAWARGLNAASLFERFKDVPVGDAVDDGATADTGAPHGGVAEHSPEPAPSVEQDR